MTEKEKYKLFKQSIKPKPPKPYKKLTKEEIKALTPQVKKNKFAQLNINIGGEVGGAIEYAFDDTDSSKTDQKDTVMADVVKPKKSM